MTTPTTTSKTTTAPQWPGMGGASMWMLLAFVGALFAYRLWLVPHSGISL